MAFRGRENQSHPYGSSVRQLIDQFATLPGIGRKSAERLAHYVLSIPEAEARQLADAIIAVKQAIHPCKICFNLTEQEVCSICADPRRDKKLVCVVEQPRDVVSLEATSSFQGVYHVLQGRISPLEGVGPDDLTINALVRRVKQDGVQEIIMATNPTLEGDGTALYISNLLEHENVEITRLARGIASGSVLEFANKEMLADALQGRQRF
ncbi:MAG: recombination mediator RecR [Gimesia chilikensis]|uniref:recombination mediator RecR n=1 Tax=Gimesia chilikensis TaxID=2605989 RepID=UPI0037A8AEF7